MCRRGRERGEGQFGCVIWLLLLVLAIFIAYKLIPVKVKAADLRQTVVDEAKTAGTHNDDLILHSILKKAEDVGLPVTQDEVHIVRTTETIKVDVDYTVPVQFPGFTYNWHFHHHAENPLF